MSSGLGPEQAGVLASQHIDAAINKGLVRCDGGPIPPDNIQPASLDLRLGPVAYRLRCSFLPNQERVLDKMYGHGYFIDEVDLSGKGALLERNRPYLVPLLESLELPPHMHGKANPKSSTGRLDIFTRVVTDRGQFFDEIPPGYHGPLFLEVVPRTFTVKVQEGLTLNQLRLMSGSSILSDSEIGRLHEQTHLLFRNGRPLRADEITIGAGLFLGIDLSGPRPAYRAREHSGLIDLGKYNHHAAPFWDPVKAESPKTMMLLLEPEKFYLLMSRDGIRIPPGYAAEMTAYDPTSGELRTHYAGFFDPGFGHDLSGMEMHGSKAALEVRAHDVPFGIEHGQNVCKLTFERMIDEPDRLYGSDLRSHYQMQQVSLSKHFIEGNRRSEATLY